MYQIGNEQDDEGYGIAQQANAAARTDVLVVDIVHYIKDAQHTGQEHDGQSEDEYPGIEQGVESVGSVGPTGDDGRNGSCINQILLGNDEVRALEERSYGTAQKQRTQQSVEDEAPLERLRAQEVAELVLELVADSLNDEGEEDDHPQPVGSAKRGGVEEGIGGEEGSTEGDQCSESELPLTAGRVQHQPLALFGPAEGTDA